MGETTTDAVRVVNAYVDVWNERDYSRIPDLVTESFVMHDPAAPPNEFGPAGEVHGPEGLEQFIREVVAGFSDFHVTVFDTVSSDDLVMYDGELTMTHDGEFNGIPPTDREASVWEMSKYRLADGKIREHRVCFDMQSVLRQLGVGEE